MAVPRKERVYQKHAWILLFLVSAFLTVRGIAAIFVGGSTYDIALKSSTGMTWNELLASNPGVARFILDRVIEEGVLYLGFGMFGLAISGFGYRRGERWAWYASLPMPITSLVFIAFGALPELVFLTLSLLGLFLPYRKFFPKKSVIGAASA